MDKVTTFLFKIADVLAYLFIIGALISLLILPFNAADQLYHEHNGREFSLIGMMFYALHSVFMGAAAYSYLRRRIVFFSLFASIAILGTTFIQSFVAGILLMGLVLFMLVPCCMPTPEKSK